MDFAYTPQQEALRREVRDFIKETRHRRCRGGDRGPGSSTGRRAASDALFKKIHARGWLGISYPKEYGGQGGDRISQYIVEEEFSRANIPVGLGGSGAPAIMAAGTEEQKRYFIPKLISGNSCSRRVSPSRGRRRSREPALPRGARRRRLRHQRPEDVHSTAHASTHIYLMARTNRDVPEARGHLDLPDPDGHARHHGAPAVDDPEQSEGAAEHDLRSRAHQRDVLRRRARAQVDAARRGEQGLARRLDGAESRSRRRLALSHLGAPRRGHRQLGQEQHASTATRRARTRRSATRSRSCGSRRRSAG